MTKPAKSTGQAASSVANPSPSTSLANGHGKVVSIQSGKTPMMPTVIAVSSGKGGVGKSNLSVNIATSLARRGARVLCIDADLGLANMDILMGVAPTSTTADLVRGDATIDEVLVEGPENVWLLPGASGQYDLANLDDRQRQMIFSAVDSLDEDFDAVVVDTGAGVGTNAVGFASAAKDIIIVVTGEPTSVADAYGMIKVLSVRCGVRRVKILANMVRSAAEGERVYRRLVSLADRFLQISLDYIGHVPRDPLVERAVMRGQPFVVSHPDAPASRACSAVAAKLAASNDADDRQGAIRLFWRKLLRQGEQR